MIQIVAINAEMLVEPLVGCVNGPRVNPPAAALRREKGGVCIAEAAFRAGKQGFWRRRALPRGNALFECLDRLLVHELEREAVFEVSDHAALDPAEQNRRFQRRAVLRRDGRA